MRTPSIRRLSLLVLLTAPPLLAASGDLIGYIPFATVAPQDITRDSDGTYWITAFLDNQIYHYEQGLTHEIEHFNYPVPSSYPTGIAFNPIDGTLFVTDALSGKIYEVERDGTPTERREIQPEYLQPPDRHVTPSPRGMAFDPTGDNGNGTIYFVEAAGTLIYEIRLDGTVVRTFSHPDDPDGFPGKGGTAPTSDVDLIYDAARTHVVGFYLTGGRTRITSLRRLNESGEYFGLSVRLDDSGGNVSGVLRIPFERPDTGEVTDCFVCVVDSNARFAVLEGGEPSFREVTGFECEASGHNVHLAWTKFQDYERIEVHQGCNVVATLPGVANEWSGTFPTDGVYVLSVTAYSGSESTTPPACTVVVGSGQVLRQSPTGGSRPVDIASDGESLVLVSDTLDRKVLLYDIQFQPLGSVDIPPDVVPDGDVITGLAYSKATDTVYVFDTTTARIIALDGTGAFLSSTDALLPNLEEDPAKDPDFGVVVGMDFDAAGDGGRGSLWMVELVRDWVYEVALDGEVITDFVHPYVSLDPPPEDTPFGIATGGLALVPGSPGELYLTGGTLREQRQTHIFRADKRTGAIVPGSAIPTAGIREAASSGLFTLQGIRIGGKERLFALAVAGEDSQLEEVDIQPPAVAAPTFFTALQPRYPDDVVLRFTPNGPYDALEVYRDCVRINSVPGTPGEVIDASAPSGFHEYAVRGVSGGIASDFARASLQVGVGAVLERGFLWPALSPQQVTQDPADGSYAAAVNWPGDERKVFLYDSSFRYFATRDSVVQPEWQIAALAIRGKDADRTLNYITWRQPVPIGEVAQQQFFLVKESMAGEALGETEILPPRPTNGFITYPTGLSWDPRTDTLYFLERNSRTFVQMNPDGRILRTFPHPSPPFQNFVFNLGLDLVPERGTIFITGSNRLDRKVTKVMEMTTDGALTGLEIPVGNLSFTVTGIAVHGDDLIAVGSGSFAEILRIKAFTEPQVRFVRGDSNGDGEVNLTDAVVTLDYLFRGGPPPACEKAADADDSGALNITDALATLLTLFLGAGPLPPPYPNAGGDLAPDGLECS